MRTFIRREDQIRTGDPLHPIQVRYRAAPPPESTKTMIFNGFGMQIYLQIEKNELYCTKFCLS